MIKKIMKYIIRKIKKNITAHRWNVLADIINKNKLETYVEIGVWKGDTPKYLIKNCKSLKKLYLIDLWDSNIYLYKNNKDDKSTIPKNEFEKIFVNLKKYFKSNEKIKLIKKSSEEAVKLFKDNSIDLIFIDADHSYKGVKKDIDLWLPKVKKNGYLTGHDYSISFFGVINAVNERLGTDNIYISYDTVWIYKK